MHSDSKNRFNPLMVLCLTLMVLSVRAELPFAPEQNNTLSCHETVNVSLNQNCSATVDVADVLTAVPPGVSFSIELRDRFGNIIPSAMLDIQHIGTAVTAKVIMDSNGNSCWSNIVVEDKMAPTVICSTYQVSCFDNVNYEPVHFDNCRASTLHILDQDIDNVNCDPTIAKTISTWYVAEDNYGNQSEPCLQVIGIEHVDLGSVVFPPSYELDNSTNLICTDVGFDENGFPLYEDTGVPSYNGFPLNPGNESCNLFVEYDDLLLTTDGCFRKYMRTWSIYQEICGVFSVETDQQVIEFADTADPEITCPSSRTVNTDGSPGCDAFVQLVLADYSDDCSEVIEMDIVTPQGLFNNVTSAPAINLSAGVNEIEYTVYDACENPASCTTTITVLDNAPPIARCDESSVVSLRSDGTALAMPGTFDEGSFDDCSLYKTLIRRVDDPCGCPAPVYNDMAYLGNYEGHYYYISTIERYGFESFAYATAMGGRILVTETQDEHDWVNEQVRDNQITDPFLIGLKDKDTTGIYKWPDHSTSLLNLWETGFPGDQIYVAVNEDGNWITVDASLTRYFFVMELDDPCNYSDRIYFCCEDAGQEVPLVLRVVDRAGRFNDCELTTEIQDKIAPQIVCPLGLVLDCSTEVDTSNLSIYGTASATDQCFANITSSYEANVNDCGIGEIVRTFSASDANGQSTCEQVISLEMTGNPVDQDINWPEDYESDLGCLEGDLEPENLPDEFAFPDFTATDCSVLVATHSDQVYSFTGLGDNACFKVIRTWIVEDLCLNDQPGYQPLEYQQVLKIGNSSAPVIDNGCQDLTVTTSDCNEAPVSFVLDASDDCTASGDLRGTLLVDIGSDGNGTFDLEYENIRDLHVFDGSLPVGEHFALIEFRDQCGNAGNCTKFITVESNKGPTAVCVPGLVTTVQNMDLDGDNITDTTMVVLRPENLDAGNESLMITGSNHACGFDIFLSFSADLNDQSLSFDCGDVGSDNVVDLWVTDVFGNTSVCQTIIAVTDPNDRCDQNTVPRYDIGGEVYTEDLKSVAGVSMTLQGGEGQEVITGLNGDYAFPSMPEGSSYTVRPYKNDNPLNGVSTLDILKIQRHILGLEPLETPYKRIAADIDHSGNVSARDMIELRKLILGIYDSFPDNNSWRLINAAYKFADPADPFGYEIEERYEINGLKTDMKVDFIAVKTGDVDNNNSFDRQKTIGQRSHKKALLVTEEKQLLRDEVYELSFSFGSGFEMAGCQMEMWLDTELCQLIGVTPRDSKLDVSSFNNQAMNDGYIRMSWHDPIGEDKLIDELMTVIVKPLHDVMVSDLIRLVNDKIEPEVYIELESSPLELSFIKKAPVTGLEVYQNSPNPWSDLTEIKYHIQEKETVTFSIYDVNGRLLYRQASPSRIGVNSIVISREQLNVSGLLYYEIIAGSERYLNKMILLD